MKKPIDKEYLENSFKDFDTEVLSKKYLNNDDLSIHTHLNKSTLDKLSESSTGTLLFDGREFSDGQDGVSGSDGKSAYEIAVDNGFVGTEQEWLESLKGEPGENGKDADINNITPESIGAASLNHFHGHIKTITLSTTEPTTVAEGEIVLVYEDSPSTTPTKILTKITATNPIKTKYTVGETLDLTGVIVTAHFSDNSTQDITQASTFDHINGSTLDTEGDMTITVSYIYDGVIKDSIITVSVINTVEIVTWADGTDEQLVAMLDAHYNGQIDIYDYWHVGDERIVRLSAMETGAVGETHVGQNVTMVLMNAGGKELIEPINEKNECAFIVGQKGVLATTNTNSTESGYMNKTDTSSGSWDGCMRRTWCNETYRNALPDVFRLLFKQHNNVTADTGGSSSKKMSVDYFALPSEKEVFGSTIYASSTAEADNKQFTYYETLENCVKKPSSGAATSWYTRSPYGSKMFCIVSQYGSISYSSAATKYGIAPFGVI